MKCLVLGIGNLLRSDDGIGIHIIDSLRKENLDNKIDINEGLSGLDVLDAINGYDRVIIVDAIKSNVEPGTIYKLSLEDLSHKQTLHSYSTHDVDFLTVLKLGSKLFPGKMPNDIIIIAVEAEDITTISEKCTPKVEKAIKEVVELIKGLL
ncbi:MAG: hydrogenase maturation protease [Nitrospirota bacterium]